MRSLALFITIYSCAFLLTINANASRSYMKYTIIGEGEGLNPECVSKNQDGCAHQFVDEPGTCHKWTIRYVHKSELPYGSKIVSKELSDEVPGSEGIGILYKMRTFGPSRTRYEVRFSKSGYSRFEASATFQNDDSGFWRTAEIVKEGQAGKLFVPRPEAEFGDSQQLVICHRYDSTGHSLKPTLNKIEAFLTYENLPVVNFSSSVSNDNVNIAWTIGELAEGQVRTVSTINIKRKISGTSDASAILVSKVDASLLSYVDTTVDSGTSYEYLYELCDQNDYCEKKDDSVSTFKRKNMDIDGDGNEDIFWRDTSSGKNHVYLQNGKVIKDSKSTFTVGINHPWQIFRGDFDGNGISDTLWRKLSTGENWIVFMDNISSPVTKKMGGVVGPEWDLVSVGDFNGDKKDDLVWRNSLTGSNWMYQLNGNSIIKSSQVNLVPDLSWVIVTSGDLNGDQKDDLIWRNQASGAVYIYFMDGNFIKEGRSVFESLSLDWKIVESGDFDANGVSDLLYRNSADGNVHMQLYDKDGKVKVEKSIATITDSNWKVAQVSDFDGDNASDILWRNYVTGQNWMYLMNGILIREQGEVNTVSPTSWDIFSVRKQ